MDRSSGVSHIAVMRSERRTLPARAGGAPETTSACASHASAGQQRRLDAILRAPAGAEGDGVRDRPRAASRAPADRGRGRWRAGMPSAWICTTWLLSNTSRVGGAATAFGSMRTGLTPGLGGHGRDRHDGLGLGVGRGQRGRDRRPHQRRVDHVRVGHQRGVDGVVERVGADRVGLQRVAEAVVLRARVRTAARASRAATRAEASARAEDFMVEG